MEVSLSNDAKVPDIKDIKATVSEALRDTDTLLIMKAQLEVSMAALAYMHAMDWKLWEIYSHLKQDE